MSKIDQKGPNNGLKLYLKALNIEISSCNVAKSVGSSTSIVGGILTIIGASLTLTGVGAAAGVPLMIAGVGSSAAGGATNIGTFIVEGIIDSTKISEANNALKQDEAAFQKVQRQIEKVLMGFKTIAISIQIARLVEILGTHVATTILSGIGEGIEIVGNIASG